jgi:hypothetical protein
LDILTWLFHGCLRDHATRRGYAILRGTEGNADSASLSAPVSPLSSHLPFSAADGAADDGERPYPEDDSPADQQISGQVVVGGLLLSIIFCVFCIWVVFGDLVPFYAMITAVFMALVLSIMGVRALGETDLNPVSGISKLSQLFFALIIPQSNKSSVLINLVAGAVVCPMSSLNAGLQSL